jgi:hypothetical protein
LFRGRTQTDNRRPLMPVGGTNGERRLTHPMSYPSIQSGGLPPTTPHQNISLSLYSLSILCSTPPLSLSSEAHCQSENTERHRKQQDRPLGCDIIFSSPLYVSEAIIIVPTFPSLSLPLPHLQSFHSLPIFLSLCPRPLCPPVF